MNLLIIYKDGKKKKKPTTLSYGFDIVIDIARRIKGINHEPSVTGPSILLEKFDSRVDEFLKNMTVELIEE
ncbi:21056_t:CDS:2 [Cetraspora pellucida]|uniref:21056_t:CDS:1 n=1 Tax=Cetraspora pellucida TaxID=1433469 RepID=A0A9N9IL34_9GLOM|nr:21056_t:CDS:2 [Cetraspora pellucida]